MRAEFIDTPFGCNTYISGASIEAVREVAREVDPRLASLVTAGNGTTAHEENFDCISIVPARSMHDLPDGWTAEVHQYSYDLGYRRVTYVAEFDGTKWEVSAEQLHASNIGVLHEDENGEVHVELSSPNRK